MPEYIRIVSELRSGDVIIIWRIYRLGQATYEPIKCMVEWIEMGWTSGAFTRALTHLPKPVKKM